ncbi:SPRY domain-containing SOCS box protein 3-like [Anneissia japonica]|uniref:SPRY domain-containing SOCS box protein 3-like n=1 Tax=Anneissia japonica TaxID=1529436 RepID=UPI001425A298|nr:SPRY domain-containing SOCS box protein 3-like [Anneissia japonica]XP_033117757.1 SPRY domain-containing SOCS box protein 3-like [Anneissia japonica]XP_033117758.1 SPRY domain-containing SOCS box protein 3-like [Anneissia japonica]
MGKKCDGMVESLHAFNEYHSDDWCWDACNKSCDVILSTNHLAAYFHIDPVYESIGTAGVRGTKGFREGEYYWEVIFTEPPFGTAVMVGVGTRQALLHTSNYQYVNLIGMDSHSWGISHKGTIWHDGKYKHYCEPFFDQQTRIGIQLNLYNGTLTFYKNGVSLGVAFTGLSGKDIEELYPLACSTSALTELELGVRSSRKLSLQEKCYSAILNSIGNSKHKVDMLPLPPLLKNLLKSIAMSK